MEPVFHRENNHKRRVRDRGHDGRPPGVKAHSSIGQRYSKLLMEWQQQGARDGEIGT